jgi:transcriptional regulator
MPSLFEQFSADDAAELIREFPLAWVLPGVGDDRLQASMLPLLAERNEQGAVVALNGHMARRNPLYAALAAHPLATILFQGPQAYISPTWVRNRDWAPTWNYAQLRCDVEVAFDPDGGDASLSQLVDTMEDGRDNLWHISEMGDRYRGMEQQIIAFRATVRGLAGRFKLGQDERPDILSDILAHVENPALARWMRRFNPGRC